MRSFDLGGARSTAGRRWAARCSCGAVATMGAWPEALAYLSEHRRATTDLRTAWVASRPCPDLRRVEYRRPDAIALNGHHAHAEDQPASVLQQLMSGVLHTLARVVLGVHSFATGG